MGKLTIGNMTRAITGIPTKTYSLSDIFGSPDVVSEVLINKHIDNITNHVGLLGMILVKKNKFK